MIRDWLQARHEVDRLIEIYDSDEAVQQRSDYTAGLVYAGHEEDHDQSGQERVSMSLAAYIETFMMPERKLAIALKELLWFTDELKAIWPKTWWATKTGQYFLRQRRETAAFVRDQESFIEQYELEEKNAKRKLNRRTRDSALAALGGHGWVGCWTL